MGPDEIKTTADSLSGDASSMPEVTTGETGQDEALPESSAPAGDSSVKEESPTVEAADEKAPEETATTEETQEPAEEKNEEAPSDMPEPPEEGAEQEEKSEADAKDEKDTSNAEEKEKSSDDETEPPSGNRGVLYAILGILLAALVFLVGQRYIAPRLKQTPQSTEAAVQTEVHQTEEDLGIATVSGNTTPETVKKAEPETEAKKQTEPATEKKQTEKETQKKGSEVERVVFGERANNAGLATIKVIGLTDSDKANTNFKEAAFVKSAAAFLADNNIAVNTIQFFGKCTSSGRSFSYQAKLGSNKDHILVVTMYPAIPGEYVFTLVPLKDIKNQYKISETQPQTAAQPQTTAQPQTSAQPQTAAPVIEQTPNETMPASTSNYDASSFYVSNIPSTLSNYMNNADILQYRLYDYLYQNGIRNATGASVSGYDIDDESRTATIDISLNSGGSVRCYYDKDSNQYSFQ